MAAMKQLIYLGSTTDGKGHWLEIDFENSITGNCRNITEKEETRKEYWPFLEPL